VATVQAVGRDPSYPARSTLQHHYSLRFIHVKFQQRRPLITQRDTTKIGHHGYAAISFAVAVSTYPSKDMIAFNGFLRDETEVVCQWLEITTVCNNRVKGKDFLAHLQFRHRAAYDSQMYSCLWHTCSASRPMTKLSLERHIREQHFPVKWACPTCTRTFTRKTTLMGHFKRCLGHVQTCVPCTVSAQERDHYRKA
jgi:hypothetical protein